MKQNFSKIYYKKMASRSRGYRVTTINSRGYLFDGNRRLSRVTADDLPCGYIPCMNDDIGGYLCCNGIKHMKYVPSELDNLSMDKLYISYDSYRPGSKRFDVVVFGNQILTALYGAKIYSGMDIKYLYKRIKPKLGDAAYNLTCAGFIDNYKKVYKSLEEFYDDRIMMTEAYADRLPEKEDTIFNYPGDNIFVGDKKNCKNIRRPGELREEWRKCLVPYWRQKK